MLTVLFPFSCLRAKRKRQTARAADCREDVAPAGPKKANRAACEDSAPVICVQTGLLITKSASREVGRFCFNAHGPLSSDTLFMEMYVSKKKDCCQKSKCDALKILMQSVVLCRRETSFAHPFVHRQTVYLCNCALCVGVWKTLCECIYSSPLLSP